MTDRIGQVTKWWEDDLDPKQRQASRRQGKAGRDVRPYRAAARS